MSQEPSSRFARWRSSTLAPFEHRVFALFWWATLVSSFGSLIQSVGASWLMATIEHSAESVALVPSPAEMQKAMEKAGIADNLGKSVVDHAFKVDAPNADVVAVRTGVVLAFAGFTKFGVIVLGLFAAQAIYGWMLYRRMPRPDVAALQYEPEDEPTDEA